VTMRGKWARPAQTFQAMEANSIPEPNSGCLLWLGAMNQFGYGRARLGGKRMVAHRAAYILACGPVPDDLELDHLCRVRCCINPAHLEPVSKVVNVRRGSAGQTAGRRAATRTHCPHGHPYSGDNLFVRPSGARECRTCMRARHRAWRTKR